MRQVCPKIACASIDFPQVPQSLSYLCRLRCLVRRFLNRLFRLTVKANRLLQTTGVRESHRICILRNCLEVPIKQFSFSDMNRASGEILEAALSEPVALTKRGKQKLVILTAEQYRKLVGGSHTMAHSFDDAPDAVQGELMTGLDALLEDDHV